MPTIDVEIQPGQFVPFEIRGDKPNYVEQKEIESLVRNLDRGIAARESANISKDEQLFDTKSGIKNAALRAKLSAAENKEEEELQLRKLYGMTEEDYTRDSRGRLALTPSGGKKIGIELEKATLIDESGFSRYDLADLAGIAPEVVGGVAGALKGAAMGLPFGPGGILIGGAVGAGTGAATGQALEESVEALTGVQEQDLGEVAKDLGTEFAIGFVSDLTLGAFGFGARGVRNYLRPGKGKTDEEILEIGEALKEGGAEFDATGRLKSIGMAPSLSAIGANPIIARQQRIGETVFGSSPRLKKNFDVMTARLAQFREAFPGASNEEVGTILLQGTAKQAKELGEKQAAAQKAVLQTLRDMGDSLGAAAERNVDIDQDIFNMLATASKAFDQEVSTAFRAIDDALETTGDEAARFIQFGKIKEAAAGAKEDAKIQLAAGRFPELKSALDAINVVGEKATFFEVYTLRKQLSDLMAQTTESVERKMINDLMRKVDMKINSPVLIDEIAESAVDDTTKNIILRAGNSLDEARRTYNEGAKIFEDIEDAGIIKNLKLKADGNMSIGIDDVRLDKIIVNDKPEKLRRIFKAVDYANSKNPKQPSSEIFRQRIAGEYLNDALVRSGLNPLDDFDPTKFKGAAFAESIRKLGRTADELFGPDADKVRNLAKVIEKTSVSNMDESVVKSIIKEVGEDAPVVDKLRALAEAQSAIHTQKLSSALTKLQRGSEVDLGVDAAADVISDAATKAKDIRQIMNVFAGDEQALQKIQGNYMERLISDFGDTLTTDGKTLAAFSKRILDANEGGKLKAIFGDEKGEELVRFAKMLKVNAQTATGGDLIAANIAAGPLQNLDKLARLFIFSRLFSTSYYYRGIYDDYLKLKTGLDPADKASLVGRLMTGALNTIAQSSGQALQEGKREAEAQIEAKIKSTLDTSGIGQQIQQLQQQVTNPNNSSGIAQAPVVPAQQPAAQSTLRQQAAQNPAVAQALGIRGATAGLI